MEELEKRVLETVKSCQVRNEAPLVLAMELSKCVGGSLCPELAEVWVSQLCFSNNIPSLWKFLHLSQSSSLRYPPHLLSLLASKVIPHRRSQSGAYRLYLELVSRYPFSFHIVASDSSKLKIIKSINLALQLSQMYGVQAHDLGFTLVLYFFSIVIGLIDSMMDDWGLQIKTFNTATDGSQIVGHNMDTDFEGKLYEQHEQIKRTNTTTALNVLTELVEKRKSVILLLESCNKPEKFNTLLQKLQFLEAHMSTSSKLKSSSQIVLKLSANIRRALVSTCERRKSLLNGI